MWALRRSANPLRIHAYCLWSSRTCRATVVSSKDNLRPSSGTCHLGQSTYSSILSLPRRLFQSSNTIFLMRSSGLCSQAAAESSKDEDGLKFEFSEIENNAGEKNGGLVSEDDAKHILGNNAGEKNGGLVSEDDAKHILGEDFQNELELSDTKMDTLLKKRTSSEFVNAVLDAPLHDLKDILDKHYETVGLSSREMSSSMANLRKCRMYAKALQMHEWLEAMGYISIMGDEDHASRFYLIWKARSSQEAEKYLGSIPYYYRLEAVHRSVLAYCISVSETKTAQEVFNKLRDLGFEITEFACNQLLWLHKRHERRKIDDIISFMFKENIKLTLPTYKILIDIRRLAHDIQGMEDWYVVMKEDGIEPDFYIQSLMARHFIKLGFKEKAVAMLKEMEKFELEYNNKLCFHLLHIYSDLGMADHVVKVWKALEVLPGVYVYRAAIEAFGKLGMVKEAEAVFDKMTQLWTQVPLRNYTALLDVYAKHKMLAKGKDLAKWIAKNGCRIGPWMWDCLVRLHVESGEVEKAESILLKVAWQNKTKPLFSTFMTIMEHYAQKGDVHNAEKMFHMSREWGYVSRLRQYQVLLQAYINAKSPAYGFRHRMMADKVHPDKAFADQLAEVDAFKKSAISDLVD